MVNPKLIQKAKARIQSRSPNAFGIEPSNDEILKEVSSIEQENKEQNSAEEQDRNAQLESRMESSQKSRALFGDQISPELKEYAYNIFPSLNELTSKYNTEIPFSPRSNIEIPFASKEMPSTEIKSRQPASIAERPQKEISKIENQKPIQQEPKKAATPIAPIQTEQQQSDIEKLIKQSEEEEDRVRLSKQSAKLRDAIMGAGIGEIKKTDLSMYEDLEKKAKRPIQNLLLKQELEDKQAQRDPNSNISKLMRKSLEDLGMNMSGLEGVPYSQLEKLYPALTQGLYTKIAAESKKEENSLKRAERADRNLEKLDQKQRIDLYRHIDTSMGRLQKDFNEYEKGREQIDVAKDLYEGVKSGKITAGSADLVTLYNLIKGIDPGSVVKEGEIKLAQSAQSLWGKIRQKGESAFEGALLDPKTRESFGEILNAIQKSREITFARKKAQFVQSGISKGLDKDILEEGIYGGPTGVESSRYLKSLKKEDIPIEDKLKQFEEKFNKNQSRIEELKKKKEM